MTWEEILETLDDTERNLLKDVETGHIELDGVMSPLTRLLATRFSTEGVDMDQLWAYTPMDWACPACGRTKEAIARPNKNNQLMCRLVDHHDHMKDLLEKVFDESLPS